MSNAAVTSPSAVLFSPIEGVKVNPDGKTAYSTSQKIDTLIQELREGGPFVALGQFGPSHYSSEPFALQSKFGGEEIFGWQRGSRTATAASNTHTIVVGARKLPDGKERVYFMLSASSDDLCEHHPSDPRIFVSSYQRFQESLETIYPPAIEEAGSNLLSDNLQECSKAEIVYIKRLAAVPVMAILGSQKEVVKALGQKIFDKFKRAAGDSSDAGWEALVNIWDAVSTCTTDGTKRAENISQAWSGIGDDANRWTL